MVFVLVIHSLVCILLVIAVLMQAGRGGGLTEGFAAAENMFGARTNEFMVRVTCVLAVIFLLTSMSLAHMSARRDQSIMDRLMDKSKKPDISINIPVGDPNTPNSVETPKTVEVPVDGGGATAVTPDSVPVEAVPAETK